MCTQSKCSCVAFKEGCPGPDNWAACQACSSVRKQPHPHAASMKLYAEDAAETDKPWERWETTCRVGSKWYALECHPDWTPGQTYRRKRKMRAINGFYIPAPETRAPEHGTKIFVPYITSSLWYFDSKWNNDKLYPELLRRGLIFLNEADAIANAKAMCGIDPNL